jgi:hypothetical protein
MIFSNTLQQPNLPFQQCHSRASALRICLKLIVVAIIATEVSFSTSQTLAVIHLPRIRRAESLPN